MIVCTYVYVHFNCKAVYCAYCQKLIEWNTFGPHESLRIFLHERVFLTAAPLEKGPTHFWSCICIFIHYTPNWFQGVKRKWSGHFSMKQNGLFSYLYTLLNWRWLENKSIAQKISWNRRDFKNSIATPKRFGPILLCWSKGRPEKKWKGVRSQMRRELCCKKLSFLALYYFSHTQGILGHLIFFLDESC